MISDTIARSTGERMGQRKQVKSLGQMMKAACECREGEGIKGNVMKRADIKRENETNEVRPFKAALSKPGVSFICEVKKAPPSEGLITLDFPYMEIARQYQEAGADAVSVLTESEFFLGADRYLEEAHREIEFPLLRRGLIVDGYQVCEAEMLEASVVLLICFLMDMEKLRWYMGICDSLGLSSPAEIHVDWEVATATEAGADIIGIDNYNLETFEMDFINALRLRKLVDRGTMFVVESGIRTSENIELLAEGRVDVVLVGETLMRAPGKERALRELESRIGQSRT